MDTSGHWLAANTFHHTQFADLEDLALLKERQGLTLSLCIPTLNEARTIGSLVARLRTDLQDRVPLVDEIAVMDSGSQDRTLELAAAAGADVYRASEILPEMEPHAGKGENLWKAVHQLKGDILIFLDGDLAHIHSGYVSGLIGPLLHRPEVGYVKAFYDRPVCSHGPECQLGGGRVTEILIRPLLSLFVPELSALVQPLSGEYAARRSLLAQLAFPVGYGVEIGHLLDLFFDHGLEILAQTGMGVRSHRSRSNRELGRMAFALLQVMHRRLARQGLVLAPLSGENTLHQFASAQGRVQREDWQIIEPERPPLLTVPAYRARHGVDSWGQTSRLGLPEVCCPISGLES